jgi:hypothetical protein
MEIRRVNLRNSEQVAAMKPWERAACWRRLARELQAEVEARRLARERNPPRDPAEVRRQEIEAAHRRNAEAFQLEVERNRLRRALERHGESV